MPFQTLSGAIVASLAIALAACASSPAAPAAEPPSATPAATWTLTWSDEFTGPAGATFDTTKWVAETGGEGWGNQEREFYTSRPENLSLNGAGQLVITARAEPASSGYRCWYGTCGYTSARLKTAGHFQQAYGRFEARIRIPRTQGLWPAFWMLGNNIATVGWPKSGEIDVMENIGREPGTVHGTIHGPGYSGANGIGAPYSLSGGAFADDYHLYAVEWSPHKIDWFVDDHLYRRTTSSDLPAGAAWVFDHPFFLLLNVAVGGGWPGDPDGSTMMPQQMLVDYVRVYRR